MPTIYTWNVNGVRAASRNGLLEWLDRERPDILCIQEAKAHPGDLDISIREPMAEQSEGQEGGAQ